MNNLDSDPGSLLFQLILVVLLTCINGFFAASEMAIVSINKSKIKKLSSQGDAKAKLLEKLIDEPSNFLSTIQIGITLAGFFSSASAALGISKYILQIIYPLNIPYSQELSTIIVTLILSYFTLVFGELVPKRIALKSSEKIALFSVKSVYIISIIAKPFIKLLSISTSVVLKLVGYNNIDAEEKISEEEIKTLVSQSLEDGCIEIEEEKMIYSIFEFNDKNAKEIMTSRNDIFFINLENDLDSIINSIINCGYSRIPAYKYNVDNIVGVLYVRDLLTEAKKVGFENIDLENILHEPCFILETRRTNELFKILKHRRIHLAMLFDEYGGISGLVTMEDLIEEIMGDIEDEYDEYEPDIIELDESNFLIKGIMPINEFNDKFYGNIEPGEYDTLNGYLLTKLGKIPAEGYEIEIDDFCFTVDKVCNRRIESIKVSLKNKYLEA